MKDKTFLTLSGLFFILFFGSIAALTLDRPKSITLRASSSTMSPLKSFVAIYPQIAVVGDEQGPKKPTKVKVTVYVRDVNGQFLANRQVKITTSSPHVTISPSSTQNTNENGDAQFFLTSKQIGDVKISVTDVSSNSDFVSVPSVSFVE